MVCVVVGTLVLNAFVFRSYNVVGSSMENTLHNDDRIIVNRLPVTWSHFWGSEYVPERGQVIVFANGEATGPLTCEAPVGKADQYIIKRVIAFPGERVTVKDGVLTVYNEEHPNGFSPDEATRVDENNGPKEYSSGEVDMVVPEGEILWLAIIEKARIRLTQDRVWVQCHIVELLDQRRYGFIRSIRFVRSRVEGL